MRTNLRHLHQPKIRELSKSMGRCCLMIQSCLIKLNNLKNKFIFTMRLPFTYLWPLNFSLLLLDYIDYLFLLFILNIAIKYFSTLFDDFFIIAESWLILFHLMLRHFCLLIEFDLLEVFGYRWWVLRLLAFLHWETVEIWQRINLLCS